MRANHVRDNAVRDAHAQVKAAHRQMWGLGDYHRFATSTVWQLGPVLVEACGIRPGQRVLDVAAGTGNVAIRAAQAGASVIASDLTAANFDAGRRAAAAEGVELEWREADAEALPFADGEFDAVTSCFGAIFAPDHQAVADELLRVCRRGGTIGLITFTADGAGGEFFGLLGRYAPPPPPGALSPLAWGSEAHVRDLFGERVASLEMSRRSYVETAAARTSTASCSGRRSGRWSRFAQASGRVPTIWPHSIATSSSSPPAPIARAGATASRSSTSTC